MDPSALNPKNSHHVRSNSLPSKLHPFIDQVDEQLCRLKQASKATSSSSELCHKLNDLQDLHESIDRMLLLSHTQHIQVEESDKKSFNDLLEGSIKLLDLCDIAKDALLQSKECVHKLESVLRRRGGGETLIASEVQKCLSSRKLIKKTINKALKAIETKSCEKSQASSAIVSSLKQAEVAGSNVVESLLSYLAGPKFSTNSSHWSLVSKLVQSKRVACEVEETSRNEVALVDAALHSIASQKTKNSDFHVQVDNLQNALKIFGSNIEDLEGDLEALYRHLIKTRVSLLNIYNY
ncbi:hypothetical protein IC582_001329 [Cucumis melo]|uniref:DUF241 domain protein n=2 Tax=Cucumis melo TaxID=3656 RepID=A0A5D3DJA0_CUCMM|nr:uncharacterized protein LOC103490392 [Cucumis melo]TYK23299.1 uncharacterized protein E5676_scaffold142G003570 [Cucumis melo var. makuwa]